MKWLSAIVIVFLTINTANAGAFQRIDKLLLDGGIVDENYIYIDEWLANYAFRDITNSMSASLPVKLNSYTEATSIIFTPYFGSYFYTIDVPLSGENIEAIRQSFTKDNYIKNICDNIYDAKFQKANSFTLDAVFRDTEGEVIAKVVLDKDTCHTTEIS